MTVRICVRVHNPLSHYLVFVLYTHWAQTCRLGRKHFFRYMCYVTGDCSVMTSRNLWKVLYETVTPAITTPGVFQCQPIGTLTLTNRLALCYTTPIPIISGLQTGQSCISGRLWAGGEYMPECRYVVPVTMAAITSLSVSVVMYVYDSNMKWQI